MSDATGPAMPAAAGIAAGSSAPAEGPAAGKRGKVVAVRADSSGASPSFARQKTGPGRAASARK